MESDGEGMFHGESQPYVRIRINTFLMREIFTTFYEENCYAKENLKKILYIYYKKYLRFNPEIEELHKKN